MLMTNIAVVNWHTYGITDIALEGQTIGLVGDNGHGKSTVLDACQVILTGGVDNGNLNKRAAGGVKKGSAPKGAPDEKRSIRSYCLGQLDAHTSLRTECYTYVALAFEDPAKIKPPVTLLMCFSATSENSKAHLEARAIIKGVVIKSSDIVKQTDDGQDVIEDWDDTRQRLEIKIAKENGSLKLYTSTAKEFVEDYMLALMYRGQFSVRKQFLKNLGNSIAFTNVESATEFVQKYVLPEKPIDIHTLKSSAALFNTLLERVTEVENCISVLDKLIYTLETRRDLEKQMDKEKAISSFAAARGARKLRCELVKEYRTLARDFDKKSIESVELDSDVRRLEAKKNTLLENRAAIGDFAQLKKNKDLLTSLIKQHDARLSDVIGGQGIGRMAQIARPKLDALKVSPELADEFRILNTVVNGTGNASPEYLPSDPDKADKAFRSIVERLSLSIENIDKEQKQLIIAQDKEERRLSELDEKIEAIKSSSTRHGTGTRRFLQVLLDAGIEASVLCDIIEITDETWRDAVESLLGSSRDVIFVAPEHLPEAYKLQRSHNSSEAIRIATTGKLGRHEVRQRANTVASLLTTDNSFASAFLDIKYGSIQLAASDADFDRPGRWLTRERQFEDGTSATILRKTEPRIGREAAAKALPIFVAEKAECVTMLSSLNARIENQQVLINTLKAFHSLSTRIPSPDRPFAAAIEESRELVAQIEETKADIERIENDNDTSSIDLMIDECNEELEEVKALQKESTRLLATLEIRRADALNKMNGSANTPGSRAFTDKLNVELKTTMMGLRFPLERNRYFKEYIDRIVGGDNHARIREVSDKLATKAKQTLDIGKGDAKAETEACIDLLNVRDDLPSGYSLVEDVLPWATEKRDDLKNNILFDYLDQLNKAKEKGEDIFKNGFLNALAEQFSEVREQIRNLNSIIRQTAFLGEVYSINLAPAPGREMFHTAVEAHDKIFAATSGGGLLASILSDEEQSAMDEIKELIFNGKTTIDLDEFTDYRKYFVFDLKMKHEETGVSNNLRSRLGTGSGGEVQTPYYICLMAAMSNVYYGGPYKDLKKDEGGLCIAIFDEAFSNMDDSVTGQVIDLGKRLGLQLLVCGPSNKKVTMQRNCDTVLTVMRSSDKRRTNIYGEYIHQRTRDELLALDPRMLTDEQIIELKDKAA